MESELIELLKATFKNFDSISMDTIQELMQKTLKVFEKLKKEIQSKDEAERNRALEKTLEVKKALEEYSEELCKKMGMSPHELGQLVEGVHNHPTGSIKDQLDSFKEQMLGSDTKEQKTLRLPKKKPKTWLVG